MTAVAPIGIQVAERAGFFAGLGGGAEIGKGVVVFANEGLPGGGAGADVKGDFGLRKLRGFLGERMVRLVTPVHGDELFGQATDEFGMFQDDVAPEHHGSAATVDFALEFLDEVEIDAAFALGLATLFALAFAEVPGFVAADVEILAGKIGEQFVVETADERQGAGMFRGEGRGAAQEILGLGLVRLGNFGEVLESAIFEEIAEMAEGVLIGHKVNAQFAAAGVEDADFLAGEGAPALPDGLVIPVGEGVLGVELQFVDLEIGESFDEVEQGGQLGHAAAGDVEHNAAPGEVGPVADFDARQATAVFAEQLAQRGGGGAETIGFAEFDENTLATDV